jgi:CubicO group peptidase (beta-lactamase class C family)
MLSGFPDDDQSLPDLMARFAVQGMGVTKVEERKIEWSRGYGFKHVDGEAVTPETLFQACSISKAVSAIAIVRLAQEGVVDLDEDVNAYLTSWKVPKTDPQPPPITLRQLLGHVAGTTVHGFPGYERGSSLPSTVDVLEGKPPANTPPVRVTEVPGAAFRYSGGGITIVQQVMTDLLKQPFPNVMRELVLAPLGMAASTFEQPLPPSRWGEAATGHHEDGTPVPGGWHVYPEMAAAGLWTTSSDLARVVIEVQRGWAGMDTAILSQRTARMMLRPQSGGPVGIGFWVEKGRSLRFFHGGDNEGFQCLLTGEVDTGSGMVIMTNGQRGGELIEEARHHIASPPQRGSRGVWRSR